MIRQKIHHTIRKIRRNHIIFGEKIKLLALQNAEKKKRKISNHGSNEFTYIFYVNMFNSQKILLSKLVEQKAQAKVWIVFDFEPCAAAYN